MFPIKLSLSIICIIVISHFVLVWFGLALYEINKFKNRRNKFPENKRKKILEKVFGEWKFSCSEFDDFIYAEFKKSDKNVASVFITYNEDTYEISLYLIEIFKDLPNRGKCVRWWSLRDDFSNEYLEEIKEIILNEINNHIKHFPSEVS